MLTDFGCYFVDFFDGDGLEDEFDGLALLGGLHEDVAAGNTLHELVELVRVGNSLALSGVLRAVAEHGGDVPEEGKEEGREGGRDGCE